MQQPKSIERFEQLFFLTIVISIVMQLLNWDKAMAMLQQSSVIADKASVIMIISLIIVYGVWILLWFFIARRGAEPAKWIYVVLVALEGLRLVAGLVLPRREGVPTPDTLSLVIQIVNYILTLASVWLLFQPDTRPWFNKGVDPTQ